MTNASSMYHNQIVCCSIRVSLKQDPTKDRAAAAAAAEVGPPTLSLMPQPMALFVSGTILSTVKVASSLPTGLPLPAAPMLIDCTQGAITFFGNARIPATLVAGSALATLFGISNVSVDHPKWKEAVVRRIDALMALFSFLLSVTTVIVSTTASTDLLLGSYDPMATDVYHFLKREFQYEFVLTRWTLLTSLLAFLTSVFGRLLLDFRLLERKRLGFTALLLMGSLMAFLVSHVNASLNCWQHLGWMTLEVFQLIWGRTNRPLTLLAVIMLGSGTSLALFDIYKAIINPNIAEEDLKAKKA